MKNRKHEIGAFGEERVARYYRFRFYRIRKKNYKVAHKEIDLIVENATTLAFVEVKTRTQVPSPSAAFPPSLAVNYEKQQNLISAARAYLALHPTKKNIRFDVAEVIVSKAEDGEKYSLNYIENAF